MENFQEKKQELELKRDLDAKQQKELAEKKQELEQCGKLLGDILSLLRSKQVVSFNRVFTDYRWFRCLYCISVKDCLKSSSNFSYDYTEKENRNSKTQADYFRE